MQLQFYDSGREGFPALLDLIDAAQCSIEIQIFIWRDDPLGRRFAEAILQKADAGVSIHIKKDLLGGIFEHAEESRRSLFHPKLPAKLKVMSAAICCMYPMKGKPWFHKSERTQLYERLISHPNIRIEAMERLDDHSKYLIIDSKILVLSGMNFEEKEYSNDLLGRPYHDFMLIMHDKTVVESFKGGSEILSRDLSVPDRNIYFLRNGSNGFHIKECLLSRLSQAKSCITIVMAYIDDPDIIRLLLAKSASGVSVCIYSPHKANIQDSLNRRALSKLFKDSKGKISIYLCHHMIHGKLILIDEDYFTFGSCNLNHQAMVRLKETNVGLFASAHGLVKSLDSSIQGIHQFSIKVTAQHQLNYNKLIAFAEYVSTR